MAIPLEMKRFNHYLLKCPVTIFYNSGLGYGDTGSADFTAILALCITSL